MTSNTVVRRRSCESADGGGRCSSVRSVSGQHSLQELFRRDPCTANGAEADDHQECEPITDQYWSQLRKQRLNLPDLTPDFTLRAHAYDILLLL